MRREEVKKMRKPRLSAKSHEMCAHSTNTPSYYNAYAGRRKGAG
jgi:hypothetical protein